MPTRLPLAALAAGLFAAGSAGAAPSLSPVLTGDSAINAFLADAGIVPWNGATGGGSVPGDEIAVAEGRIGNNAVSGTREAGLHQAPNFTSGAPVGTEGQFSWGGGSPTGPSIEFTLERTGGNLRFTIGNYDGTITDAAPGKSVADIDTLLLRIRTTETSDLELLGLVFDDAAAGDLAIAALNGPAGGGVTGLFIEGIEGDFTLSGSARFTWTGAAPSNSALAFQIKAYDTPGGGGGQTDVPAPAALGLFGLGLLGFAAARRRR